MKVRVCKARLLAGSLVVLPVKALVAEGAPCLDGESLRLPADILDDLEFVRQ